jgi:hypothetical protein
MSGGKGVKGGNLDSLGNMGPAGDVVQRRKLAETLLGGRIAVGKYSRAQESGRRAELLAIGGSLAEIAETPSTSPPGFGVAPPKPLKPSSR